MTDLKSVLYQPRTKEDYANDLINLYPSGPAWDAKYDINSTIYKMSYAWMSGLYDVDTSLCFLIDDANPSLTQNSEVLGFYQTLLGLPDKCVSVDSSFEDQQKQVIARFGLVGEVTLSYYKTFAQAYGLDVDIVEYTGAICGLAECGTDSACVGSEDENLEFCLTFIVDGDYTLFECELNELQLADTSYYFVEKK